MTTDKLTTDKSIVRRDDDVQFVWREASPDPRIPPARSRPAGRAGCSSCRPASTNCTSMPKAKCGSRWPASVLLIARSISPGWIASAPLELEYGYHPLELEFRKNRRRSPHWPVLVGAAIPVGAAHRAQSGSRAGPGCPTKVLLTAGCWPGHCAATLATARRQAGSPLPISPAGRQSFARLAPSVSFRPANAQAAGNATEPIDQVRRRRMPQLRDCTKREARAIAAYLSVPTRCR